MNVLKYWNYRKLRSGEVSTMRTENVNTILDGISFTRELTEKKILSENSRLKKLHKFWVNSKLHLVCYYSSRLVIILRQDVCGRSLFARECNKNNVRYYKNSISKLHTAISIK